MKFIIETKKEIWKNIPGFKYYQASNLGNIRCLNFRNFGIIKILKQGYDKNGYKKVNLNCVNYRAHRIIAKTFLNNYNENLQVNHINGIKDDNRVENLEMVNSKENSWHRTNILKKGKLKPVIMLEKNTLKVIDEFDSIREAERKTNIQHSTISKVCKGKKKSAGGYKWKYKKEE